jgi:ribonuclease BN (tRNA processing enzyme)
MTMSEEVGVKRLALTHLKRSLRRDKGQILRFVESHAGRVRVLVPEPLEEFAFS